MKFAYPVSLDVAGRLCVVVGGGTVAEHKVGPLLDAGAAVMVVARRCTKGLAELAARGEISLEEREYRRGDLRGAFLAVAATDDPVVNRCIFEEAEMERVLLNAVDDVEHCHFAAPALVRRDDLLVAISTGGKAPALAKKLRRELDSSLGAEYGALVRALDEVRAETLPQRTVAFDTWAERWQSALDHDLLSLARAGRIEELKALVRDIVTGRSPSQPSAGHVALVGAGPGDPALITVRGRDLIREADVLVYDRLVHPSLLEGKRAIYAGKDPRGRSSSQDDINELLITLARGGKKVVRLKGGDPFVFGRGREEIDALTAAGIDCEVVPAPSSALAGLAAAGIPLTDRRVSSSVAIVTGHSTGASPVRWRELGSAVDTVVVLMGLARLEEIAAELMKGGVGASTPAAIVERATWPDQRVVKGPVSRIAALARAQGVSAPAVIVIGAVAGDRFRVPEGITVAHAEN